MAILFSAGPWPVNRCTITPKRKLAIKKFADVIFSCLLPIGTSTGVFPPSGVTNGFPTHAHGDVTPPRHVQPPGSPLPSVGLTRFKPSPEVAKLGPSPRAVVVPVNSTQSSQPPAMPVVLQSVVKAKPSSPKQVVPVSSNKSRSSRKGNRRYNLVRRTFSLKMKAQRKSWRRGSKYSKNCWELATWHMTCDEILSLVVLFPANNSQICFVKIWNHCSNRTKIFYRVLWTKFFTMLEVVWQP